MILKEKPFQLQKQNFLDFNQKLFFQSTNLLSNRTVKTKEIPRCYIIQKQREPNVALVIVQATNAISESGGLVGFMRLRDIVAEGNNSKEMVSLREKRERGKHEGGKGPNNKRNCLV